MATITLKDRADVDVVFTVVGEDMKTQQFTALAKTDNDSKLSLIVSQDKPAMNAKASHRITIKPLQQEFDGTTGTMSQGSVSALITIPPGMALESVQDLCAYAARVLLNTATIELLYKGGRLA